MAYSSGWSITLLIKLVTFSILCNAPLTAKKNIPQLIGVSAGIGGLGMLYYYYMHTKEINAHQEQESFINQLILDQSIDPALRESVRNLIQRCSKTIASYHAKKNLSIIPLLISAAGLGYALSVSSSPKTGN